MSLTLIGSTQYWFGLPAHRKVMIDAIPPGATLRYRFNHNDWPRAFIKTDTGIREYIVINRTPEYWGFGAEQRRNDR